MLPDAPTSRFRLFLSKTQPARVVVLILAVAVAAMALGSQSSSAGTFGQKFLAKAAAMIGVNASTSANALDPETAPEPSSSSLATERRGHTATRLQDGSVLVAGGENSTGALNGTEVFDPASGTFSAAGNMGAARVDHTATLLADGRVLIAGGRNSDGSLATSEIFDPATGTFAAGPTLSVARAGHSATLFADGRIFIAGGDANGTAEVLNSSLSGSTVVGAMSGARSMHSAALMLDGRVLLVGGRDGSGNALNTGEIYGPDFSNIATTLKLARVRPHVRVLFDGKVQVIGGNDDGSMEVYDPAEGAFGAYAHVVPESDPCAGLHGHVLASQTRAALFHTGSADALLDRSGHTITELGGQALVVGGSNGAGAFLGTSSTVSSSSAQISTNKMDYAPGETATITGRGFQAGEVVRVKIHEDPHTPQERGFDVAADADGNFAGQYLVMDYDLDMKFIVGARGLTSGVTAQTTFTDAQPQILTITVGQSPNPVTAGNSATYTVSLSFNGNSDNCTVGLTASATGSPAWPAPPGGGFFSFSPTSLTGSGVSIRTSTLTINTPSGMASGTYNFTVGISYPVGHGCQNTNQNPTVSGTLVVDAGTVATTTAVTNATATYGDTAVTLNATVTPASGPAVNNGQVTFTVKQGATTIGAATTDNTVVAGAASVNYLLPPGTAAGPYTIQASYSPGTGFTGSSGSGSLTIDKAGSTTTITCAAGSVYTGSAIEPCTYTVTGNEAGNPVLVSPTAVPTGNYTNNVNAGVNTASASFTFTGDANHNGSSDSETFSIDKAGSTTTITCAAGSVYTGSPIEPCTYTVTGNETGNPVLVPSTAVPSANYTNNVNAGVNTASASFTFTGDANHNGSSDSETFSIDKAGSTTTITCAAGSVYTGSPIEPCTYTVTGNEGGNPVLVPSTAVPSANYTNNVNAGVNTASASFTFTGDANHNGSSDSETFSIDKAGSTTTITCAAGSIYTGSPIEPCTYTVTGNETGNPVLVPSTAVPSANYTNNVNAGVNTASASFTFTGDANHNGSSDSETFSIDKADSTTTITCAAGSVYTGSPIEPCTYTVTGNEVGNPVLVPATAVPGANYTNNVNAGVNTASASFTFTGDANHNGSSDSETFSIDKRTLTATIINDPTKVYDGNANATLAPGNFSIANLVAGQNFTVTKTTGTYNSPNVTGANTVSTTLAPGDFTPTGGANPNNYNLPTSASGPGHITAKPLTITADNKSFLFGDPLPTLTASFNAFVAGEGVGNLTGSLTFTIKNALNVAVPYNASTPSGTYTIIPGGVTSTNYAITFVNGTLTIGAWTITGFYQPVDMNTPSLFIWNTIKGGSTVPLKFNIYAGPVGPLTERKNVSDVMFGTVQFAEIPCSASAGLETLVDYVTNTGNTTLRYDTTGGQFIQNWQTPKPPNKCYQVRMTALDGSHIDAYFKTK